MCQAVYTYSALYDENHILVYAPLPGEDYKLGIQPGDSGDLLQIEAARGCRRSALLCARVKFLPLHFGTTVTRLHQPPLTPVPTYAARRVYQTVQLILSLRHIFPSSIFCRYRKKRRVFSTRKLLCEPGFNYIKFPAIYSVQIQRPPRNLVLTSGRLSSIFLDRIPQLIRTKFETIFMNQGIGYPCYLRSDRWF